jgi:hypothetical protein
MDNATPSLFNFYPHLPWQKELVNDVLHNFDYSLGTWTAFCSGSLGSGKSLIASHIAIRHCLEYDGARILIGRKALPDLKDTLFAEIIEHLDDDALVQGRDYFVNETRAKIKFKNGSEIIGRSWADRKYKKLGSLKLSAAIIEEAAENDDQDEQAIDFIKMRVGRLPHIPVRFMLLLTNPDSPQHFLYRRFIAKDRELSKVYYSHLRDNPFLDQAYADGLANDMDPKLAKRMLEGHWTELYTEVIYHQYKKEFNYRDYSYVVNPRYPIRISWDFNIGEGKPMSLALIQIIGDEVHIFNEVVIEGMRTLDSCEELGNQGFLDYPSKYIINGDATGKHRDTRQIGSDYDIINQFFSNYKNKNGMRLSYEMAVPRSNPPIRTRHNKMNAYFCNAHGKRRMFVYKDAPTADQGFSLAALKKTGQFIEDDSKAYQHLTTSVGYALMWYLTGENLVAPMMSSPR